MPLINSWALSSVKNKPVVFSVKYFQKSQFNYTTTKKELILMVECIKQFRGILFVCKINVSSDHKPWSKRQK